MGSFSPAVYAASVIMVSQTKIGKCKVAQWLSSTIWLGVFKNLIYSYLLTLVHAFTHFCSLFFTPHGKKSLPENVKTRRFSQSRFFEDIMKFLNSFNFVRPFYVENRKSTMSPRVSFLSKK